MPLELAEFIDVKARARNLGLNVPTRLCLLPTNFATARSRADLVYEPTACLLREEWRRAGLVETPLEKKDIVWAEPLSEEPRERVELSFFIGAELLSENYYAATVAVDCVATILEEIFRSRSGRGQAVIAMIVERQQRNSYLMVRYDGDARGPVATELRHGLKQAWESQTSRPGS